MARNDTLARIADALAELSDVTVTFREDAHMEPRRETRTHVTRDTRLTSTGAGVTSEIVEREVKEEVVVGERKVVDDRWLDVEVDSHEAVREMAALLRHRDIDPDEAITATTLGDTHEYEIRA